MSEKIFGVLGTFVWDEITGDVKERNGWGGLFYSVIALRAALGSDWVVRPLALVGCDRFEEVHELLGRLDGVDLRGIEAVGGLNNVAYLSYHDSKRTTEKVHGVPPWNAVDASTMGAELDAVLVNFVAGNELDIEAARALVSGVPFSYCDWHGLRPPETDVSAWLGCFDVMQASVAEVDRIGLPWAELWNDGGARAAMVCTLGSIGCVAAEPGFTHQYFPTPAVRAVDPTGCGDVFAGTMAAAMATGEPNGMAARHANRAAGRNAGHVGIDGLLKVLEAK